MQTIEIHRKNLYSSDWSNFRDEVCRKNDDFVYRRSKTLRCQPCRCNCKWIDSLETPGHDEPGAEGARCVHARRNLSGKRTEKISIFLFFFQSLHKNFASLTKTKKRIMKNMWNFINDVLTTIDDFVWGVPLMVLIIAGGLLFDRKTGLLADPKTSSGTQMDGQKRGRRSWRNFQFLCTLHCLKCYDRNR